MAIVAVPENCGLSAGVMAWMQNGGKALTALTGGVADYTPVTLEITGKNNYQVRVSWKAYFPNPNTRDERKRQAENQMELIRMLCATGKVKRIELSTQPLDLLATYPAPDYALPSQVLEILDYPALPNEQYVRPEDRAYLSKLFHTVAWVGVVAYMVAVHVLKKSAEEAFNYAVEQANKGKIDIPVGDTTIIVGPGFPTPPSGTPGMDQRVSYLTVSIDGNSITVPVTLQTDGSYLAQNVNIPIIGTVTFTISFATCSLSAEIAGGLVKITKAGTKVSSSACQFNIEYGGKTYKVTISLYTPGGGFTFNQDTMILFAIAFVALLGIILISR